MQSPYIVEGVRLFEEGDYFMCHETLEEYWVEAPQQEKAFLQGLIQLAVGLHHYERKNFKGARLQFGKALSRLSGYPDAHQGIDVDGIRNFLEVAPWMIEEGVALKPPPLLVAEDLAPISFDENVDP